MKISSSPLIPIARQDVARTNRRALPVEIQQTPSTVKEEVRVYQPGYPIGENKQAQSLVKYAEIQQKAIDTYKMTAAIDASRGDGDLIGVDVFA